MIDAEKGYSIATAYEGALVVKVKSTLLTGAQVGTDEAGRAVLFLPKRGWYRFSLVIGKKGHILREQEGPQAERFEDFVAEIGPWVPFSQFARLEKYTRALCLT